MMSALENWGRKADTVRAISRIAEALTPEPLEPPQASALV